MLSDMIRQLLSVETSGDEPHGNVLNGNDARRRTRELTGVAASTVLLFGAEYEATLGGR